jgi:hypothetical protein
VWAAANGRLFVGAADFGSGAVALEGNQLRIKPGHGESWVYAQPTADGKYVFRGGAGAVTADGQKTPDVVHSNADRGGFAGYFFLPAADGPFYFHVHFAGGLRGHEPRFQKDPDALTDRLKDALAAKHKLTRDQLDAVKKEGLERERPCRATRRRAGRRPWTRARGRPTSPRMGASRSGSTRRNHGTC